VVGLLLPEPPRLNFITQPTKRCLSFRFIGDAIERVADYLREVISAYQVTPVNLRSASRVKRRYTAPELTPEQRIMMTGRRGLPTGRLFVLPF
jgi:hypothetical protein